MKPRGQRVEPRRGCVGLREEATTPASINAGEVLG